MKLNIKKIILTKPNTFCKWAGKKTAIIAVIVLFSLMVPQISSAGILDSVGNSIMTALLNLVLGVAAFLVKLAAMFMEAMMKIGFEGHKNIVEIGWKVTRDFSNMFFILFLVVIAFCTILGIEQYGIKKLLPKVIGVALLINFSLVMCYVVIDFSHIAANFFINNAKEGAKKLGGEKASISGALSDSFNITKVMIPRDCNEYKDEKKKCKDIYDKDDPKLEDCEEQYQTDYENCKAYVKELKEQGKDTNFLNMLISMVLGAAVLLIAAFVLIAGGILLLVRMIFIWFLVILVPFVFLCYILPGLRSHWQKWWSAFLSWSFFAPIYAFFIWLAVKISVEKKLSQITHQTEGASLAQDQAMVSNFFTGMDHIISFVFIAGLLIGGLIAAKQFGIAGAKVAMNVGQKWGKGITGITKFEKYKAARKKVKEEAKKEAVQRRMRLREVGGIRQAIKERVPGERGRRARARKANVIKQEAKRMKGVYTFNDLRKVAGYRGFTRFRRNSRLAAVRTLVAPEFTPTTRKWIPTLKQKQKNKLARRLRKLKKYNVKNIK